MKKEPHHGAESRGLLREMRAQLLFDGTDERIDPLSELTRSCARSSSTKSTTLSTGGATRSTKGAFSIDQKGALSVDQKGALSVDQGRASL